MRLLQWNPDQEYVIVQGKGQSFKLPTSIQYDSFFHRKCNGLSRIWHGVYTFKDKDFYQIGKQLCKW